MTIAIDVGNTNVVLGKIRKNKVIDQLRIKTESLKISLTDITNETRNQLSKFINSVYKLIIFLIS